MGFCEKNGHRLKFSLSTIVKWWVFVRFTGGDRKRRVEIESGVPGDPPVLLDCGTHPAGHTEHRTHNESGVVAKVKLFYGDGVCGDASSADIPLDAGSNLVEEETTNLKFSSWKFDIPGSGESVGITVIIENNISTDPNP